MHNEASFSGVLRILFWIFAIAFLIRLIANMALPYVMRKAEQKMRENAQRFQESQRPTRSEGEVTIESNKSKSRNKGDDDYVDYVEIKD
jgi:hypothetical protein